MRFLLLMLGVAIMTAQPCTVTAQIKDILKQRKEQAKERVKDRAKQEARNAADNQLDKMRNGADTSSFSYAVAIADNAGSFEDGKYFQKFAQLGLGATDMLGVTRDADQDPLQQPRNNLSLGELFYGNRRYKRAEYFYKKALKELEAQNATQDRLYARAQSNMALLYHALGRINEAEALTKQVIDLRKQTEGERSAGYANSLNNLALIYKDEGKYNDAEALLEQARSVAEQAPGVGKASMPYALILNNQAMLFYTVGRNDEAVRKLQECMGIAEPLLRDKGVAFQRFQINLALVYQDMGKTAEAEKLFLDAMRAREKRLNKNHPDVANIKNHLAALYMQSGQLDKVEELLKDAARIFEKEIGKQHAAYANTQSNLGNFYRVKGDLPAAETALREALDIRKTVLGEAHPAYVRNQEDLALVYWQTGKTADATALFREVLKSNQAFIRNYFSPMSEAEKALYWDKLRPSFLKFYAFAVANGDKDPSLLTDLFNANLNTKAILLSTTTKLRQEILASGKKDLIQDYRTWTDQKEMLARLYHLSAEELQADNINRDSIERAANALEKKLSASVQLFERESSLAEIATKLAPDEAILDIISLRKFDGKIFTDQSQYIALVAAKGSTSPKMVILENGNELDEKFFAYYRNVTLNRKPDKYSYTQYWQRIEPLLTGKPKVYAALDGVYTQIGLNTIQKPDGKYLVDEKNFVFLTNLKDVADLKAPRKPATNKTAVLFGFPDYGSTGKIAPLPGTKVEVENVNASLKQVGYQTQVFMGKQAGEEQLKAIKKAPRLLHIATHGFFMPDLADVGDKVFGIDAEKARENPMLRAGLIFANAEAGFENKNTKEFAQKDNGILTAHEIMLLNLNGVEIATLSACETGLGDVKAGEGVYGLQRAFKVAGVDKIIMSLWTVSDEATKDLMTAFVKNWLLTGNAADAFKKAQQQLKAKYKDPYFWGAFMLIEG